jgi:hypothetical protein
VRVLRLRTPTVPIQTPRSLRHQSREPLRFGHLSGRVRPDRLNDPGGFDTADPWHVAAQHQPGERRAHPDQRRRYPAVGPLGARTATSKRDAAMAATDHFARPRGYGYAAGTTGEQVARVSLTSTVSLPTDRGNRGRRCS